MNTPPNATTRSCALARSLTRMSKCTMGGRAALAPAGPTPWNESRWPCGGGSSVTQPGYHSTGVPPSSRAQNLARSHGSGQSRTISRIQPTGPSASAFMVPLTDDAVAEVGDAVGLDHPGAFQVELLIVDVVEEADATAEQDGHEIQVDLIEKTGPEVLLGDVGGADADGTVTGHRAGL